MYRKNQSAYAWGELRQLDVESCFYVFGGIALAALALLGWMAWIHRQYAFGKSGITVSVPNCNAPHLWRTVRLWEATFRWRLASTAFCMPDQLQATLRSSSPLFLSGGK